MCILCLCILCGTDHTAVQYTYYCILNIKHTYLIVSCILNKLNNYFDCCNFNVFLNILKWCSYIQIFDARKSSYQFFIFLKLVSVYIAHVFIIKKVHSSYCTYSVQPTFLVYTIMLIKKYVLSLWGAIFGTIKFSIQQ